MRRCLLLLALAAFALGSATASGPIEMRRIELIPSPATKILSTPQGFDLDHDSRSEFIIRLQGDTQTEIYESIGDDAFVLAHVIVPDAGEWFRVPMDAGDTDADGLSDLVMRVFAPIGGGNSEKFTRVYESESANTYPTELVWEVAHGTSVVRAGLIIDADGDGKQEIVNELAYCPPGSLGLEEALVIYENDGDNSYVESYFEVLPDGYSYSYGVADDVDGDVLIPAEVADCTTGQRFGHPCCVPPEDVT